MSSRTEEELSDEEEEEQKQHKEASGGESHPRNIFKVAGVKNPAYWQCVSYIAPNNEPKKWKVSDAIGTYCTKCNKIIPYCSKWRFLRNPGIMSLRLHARLGSIKWVPSIVTNWSNVKKATMGKNWLQVRVCLSCHDFAWHTLELLK